MSTETEPTKKCKMCNELKTHDNYYKSSKGYLSSKCKPCQSIHTKKYKCDPVVKAVRSLTHKCDCGGIYNREHKLQHMKTKLHINYINRDKTIPNENPIIRCPCNGRYKKQNKSRHMKTIRHQKYLNMIDDNDL